MSAKICELETGIFYYFCSLAVFQSVWQVTVGSIHSFVYLAIKLIRDWNNKALQFILVFASARLLFASWRFGEVTMLCLESFHKFSVVFMERFKFCRGFAILSPARVVRIQFSSKINNYVIFFVSLSSN